MAPELIEGLTGIGSSLVGSLGGLFGANLSQKYNERNMQLQNKYAKEMANYMWKNFQSPQAQVSAMAGAGLNPVGMLGHGGSGAFASPSVNMPSSSPINVSGIMDISSLANMLNSVANIRKTGAEVPNIEAATANQVAETEGKKLQNKLTAMFGPQKWISDISLSFQNALLAQASTDKTKQETAYQQLHNAWQQIINEQEGINKEILEKVRDNTDTRLGLENKLSEAKIKTEESVQASNYASAEESRQRALTESQLRESRKLALDLSNELQGLENDFNYETYQKRLENFAQQVGIVKWSMLTSEMEYKDRNAYNAMQRLMLGKGSRKDGLDVMSFLRNHSTDKFDLSK